MCAHTCMPLLVGPHILTQRDVQAVEKRKTYLERNGEWNIHTHVDATHTPTHFSSTLDPSHITSPYIHIRAQARVVEIFLWWWWPTHAKWTRFFFVLPPSLRQFQLNSMSKKRTENLDIGKATREKKNRIERRAVYIYIYFANIEESREKRQHSWWQWEKIDDGEKKKKKGKE